jgi:Ran GTPase-activating protein (RanGAP) involved in mRNA processing and transport
VAEHAQIQSLNLANNRLSEKCVEPLAATLRVKRNLKELDLAGNGISNRVTKNKIKNVLTWVSEIKF